MSTADRLTRTGSFMLPCAPELAMPLFTPEGEKAWVPGWSPSYLSGATDEAGAVWTTAADGTTVTWITVFRDGLRARYARVSQNGTAGMVDVRCAAEGAGTRVHVSYDLTATGAHGSAVLADLEASYDAMLETWRTLTAQVLAG